MKQEYQDKYDNSDHPEDGIGEDTQFDAFMLAKQLFHMRTAIGSVGARLEQIRFEAKKGIEIDYDAELYLATSQLDWAFDGAATDYWNSLMSHYDPD